MITKLTKEDLNFIRNYCSIEYELRKKLERLRSKVEISSVQFDQIASGRGAHHDRMAEHAAAVDALERKYADVIFDYQDRLLLLIERIFTLDDPRQMQILRLRYVENHSWNYIQKYMHCTRNCFRLHKLALKNIGVEPEDDSEEDPDNDPDSDLDNPEEYSDQDSEQDPEDGRAEEKSEE